MFGFKNSNIYVEGQGIIKTNLKIENGKFTSFADAFNTARDTPSVALAPKTDLFFVPSNSIIVVSINSCSLASIPISFSLIIVLTLFTAFSTPLPKNLSSLSRNSSASRIPVEAPDGTAALPIAPLSKITST